MFAAKLPRSFLNHRTIRCFHCAIPTELVSASPSKDFVSKTRVDLETIQRLERLSLVDFANLEGIRRLESAIELADRIRGVDTTSVEPLYTVLEDRALYLRPDLAVDPSNRSKLLELAVRTEEDYYLAPQGNVPLAPSLGYEQQQNT